MGFSDMLGLVVRSATCSLEVCGGQPPMCPARTEGLASAQPEAEAQRQVFTTQFTNAAAEPARLEWISHNGSVGSALTVLSPGQTRGVSARTGDLFLATGATSGLLLMELFTGPAIVRECAQCESVHEPLVLCPPRTPSAHNETERPAYEPAGFVNFAPYAVDLYQVARTSGPGGATCEQHLTAAAGPMASRGQLHFASRRSARFRARRHADQRLLFEHVVGEVLIRPCIALAPPRAASETDDARHVMVALARAVNEMRDTLARQEQRQVELARLVEALHNQTSARIDALAQSVGAHSVGELDAQQVEVSPSGGTWLPR